MERGAFLDPELQKEFSRFVEIRLHTDGRDAVYGPSSKRNRDLQARLFETIALPYYAALSPDGKTVHWRAGGVLPAREMAAALREVP
jgi:hypothetical protein